MESIRRNNNKDDRQKQLGTTFGSNKSTLQDEQQSSAKKPFSSSEVERYPGQTTRMSSSPRQNRHNRQHHENETTTNKKNRKNHRHHDHPHNTQKNNDRELVEKRRQKHAKEKYQRKLEKARHMQLQREQKLDYQTRQLAQLERQHQARQKVYFGNFAEANRQFDSIADIDQHLEGGGNRERYPNLARLQTQLKEDRDKELPPYVRKYNRRNKQLFDLIEGTNSPEVKHHHHLHSRRHPESHLHHNHHHHHKKQGGRVANSSRDHLTHKEKVERWIEENLFEEQRRNPNQIVRPPEEDPELLLDSKVNALPGELGRPEVAGDGHLLVMHEGAEEEDGDLRSGGGGAPVAHVITNRLSQTRAGNFVYHRIAQSQPSNTIGQGRQAGAGAAAYGVIVRKPGLPFVAITDRRQEHNKSKHV